MRSQLESKNEKQTLEDAAQRTRFEHSNSNKNRSVLVTQTETFSSAATKNLSPAALNFTKLKLSSQPSGRQKLRQSTTRPCMRSTTAKHLSCEMVRATSPEGWMARSLMACLRWTETNRFGWKLKLNRIDFFFKLVKEKKVYYFIKIIWWIISIKTVELFG